MKLSVEKSVEKYDQVISLKDKQENKEEKY